MSPIELEVCRATLKEMVDAGIIVECSSAFGRRPVSFSRRRCGRQQAAEGATTHLLVHAGALVLVAEV